MKRLLLLVSVCSAFFTGCKENSPVSPAGPAAESAAVSAQALLSASGTKKVLLVGIDGLQYDRIQALNTPNLKSLLLKKAYTGGIRGALSEQVTLSGPGWMSVLTGTWDDRHGVTGNDPAAGKAQVKSLFRYVREGRPSAYLASIATWGPINQFLADDMAVVDFRKDGGTDAASTTLAIDKIVNVGADLVFVHLDEVDEVGHASGFGTAYDAAIVEADRKLGQLLQAVQTRTTRTGEDWLVLTVTDHGRNPNGGFSHGGQTESEKTSFIGLNKPGNTEFNTVATGIPNLEFNGLYGAPAQTSVVPTILRFLDIPITASMKLSSAPLLGTDGPRKLLFANVSTGPLTWLSSSGSNAQLYRNDNLIATVPATQGSYRDNAAPSGTNTYTLVIDQSIASIQGKSTGTNLSITAALDWYDANDNTAYLFRSNGTYVKYNKLTNTAVAGYPLSTTNSTWPGLGSYVSLLKAILRWDNQKAFVFLSDGRFLRYDMVADRTDAGYPQTITNTTWPGLGSYATKIAATVNWGNGKVYLFLSDGRYLRYDIAANKVDAGYPRPTDNSNWPGLGSYATQIAAILEWDTRYVYVLLTNNTFIKYDKVADAAVAGYPQPISATTLPGVL
jgi:hypothetical protein